MYSFFEDGSCEAFGDTKVLAAVMATWSGLA